MHIDAFGATHRGNIRSHNEDNIYVEGSYRNDLKADNVAIPGKRGKAPYTCAVFDGLGGEESGEKASYIAALGLKSFEEKGRAADIDDYVSVVNTAIKNETAKSGASSMGTTFVMLHVDGGRAYVSNVGDSRAYLLRDGELKQLSRDHSIVQSMIDNGFLDESGRKSSIYAGELTQYLGMMSEENIEPSAETVTLNVLPGDVFLLCSDGLSGELTDEEMAGIMLGNAGQDARHITALLIKAALERKCRDNVSAVVCMACE